MIRLSDLLAFICTLLHEKMGWGEVGGDWGRGGFIHPQKEFILVKQSGNSPHRNLAILHYFSSLPTIYNYTVRPLIHAVMIHCTRGQKLIATADKAWFMLQYLILCTKQPFNTTRLN